MRKLILLSLCLILSAPASFAHPPYAIRVEKDLATNRLYIKVMHRVAKGSRAVHYVEKIEVAVDDQEPVAEEFTSQRNRRLQEAVVTIPDLRQRKKVTITAWHTKGGSITKEFILQKIADYSPDSESQ